MCILNIVSLVSLDGSMRTYRIVMNTKNRTGQGSTGYIAEDYVANMLKNEGNKILARNFSTRYGEIDIIYIEKSTGDLVFGEVKYRQDAECGYPYEYVTPQKLKKIEFCAEYFIENYLDELPKNMRIDVFSVLGEYSNIEHFKNVTG